MKKRPKMNSLTLHILSALYADNTLREVLRFGRWCDIFDNLKDNHEPQ